MSTGAESAKFTTKKLLSQEDFKDRLLDFLRGDFKAIVQRVYDEDGTFDQKIELVGGGVDLMDFVQAPDVDFGGTDGLGNITSLGITGQEDSDAGQFKTGVPFENTNAVNYYWSLQHTERAKGIQINPRTGFPEYVKTLHAIGVKAAPDVVVDNGGSLTLTVDSVCEASHSHAGRTCLVYLLTPAKGATTEAVAIESLTVTWNGVNNRVTTSGILGQTTPSTTVGDYRVVLLGPTVRKVDTSATAGHQHLGVVVGTGPAVAAADGDESAQRLLDQSLATLTDYPGGPNWADGTTNPATTIVAQITKILTDLTSTSALRGAGKLTAPALTAWLDATANPAATLAAALDKIIIDLKSNTGSGADKVGIRNLTSTFHDGVTFSSNSIWAMINLFVGAMGSTSGGASGAHKVGSAAMPAMADTSNIAAESLHFQLSNLIFQIASSTASSSGARKLGIETSTATLASSGTIAGGALRTFLETLISALGGSSGETEIGAAAYGNMPGGDVRDNLRDLEDRTAKLALSNIFTGALNRLDEVTRFGSGAESASDADVEQQRAEWRGTLAHARNLIWTFTDPAGPTANIIRVYYSITPGTTGVGPCLEIVTNAVWNAALSRWDQDSGGVDSWMINIGEPGLFIFRTPAGTANWLDTHNSTTGWRRKIGAISGLNPGLSSVLELEDGRVSFEDVSSGGIDTSNPTVGTAPAPNSLYAKNTPKAWGRLFTDITTPVIDDGFNFNTAVYAGGNLDVAITFHLTLSGGLSTAPFVESLDAPGSDFLSHQVHNEGVNGFSFRAYRETLDVLTSAESETVADVKMVAYNQNNADEEWAFVVMGRDA